MLARTSSTRLVLARGSLVFGAQPRSNMTDSIYTEPVALRNVDHCTYTMQGSTDVNFPAWFVFLNHDRLTLAGSKKDGSTLLSLPGRYY
jgi:hypothetical protein